MTSAELERYRTKARRWLEDNVPRLPSDASEYGQLPGESVESFAARSRIIQRQRYEAGFAGIPVAAEFGGQGLTPAHQAVFDEEAAGFERPGMFGGTFGPVFPALLEHFTGQQKRRHLPAMFAGDELWVQLMSEPNAGSDLASVRTSARRDGDTWILNGQKVWTTGAHFSDFGMCLARTNWDVPKHAGLTMFIVDLHADGVTVRPLRQMTGDAEFNEVFLVDVAIPAGDVIGEVDRGWSVVKTWMTYEHGGVSHGDSSRGSGFAMASPFEAADDGLLDLYRKSAAGDMVVRAAVTRAYIDAVVHQLLSERLGQAMRSGAMPVQAGSLLKVGGAVKLQRREELRMHLCGQPAVAWEQGDSGWLAHQFLSSQSMTIGAGTNQVHWNGVGEHVLGLPREPAADHGIAFRDVARLADALRSQGV